MALGEETLLEELVVFDDSVVDERDLAGLVEVRMGIGIRRWAVCGPAGMADADRTAGGLFGQDAGEIVDTAGFLAEFEFAGVQDAEAGGVVAAIFETAKAFEDDVLGGFLADVADDATHIYMHCLF